MVHVLLTAAGIGTRMGQDIPKQFMFVEDKPIIIHTMEAFQVHPLVSTITVVTLQSWVDVLWAYAKQYKITKLKWVVIGGETGQESINRGVLKLKEELPNDSVVMIHDGNRCFVSSEIISNSIAVFKEHGSAVAAIPCVEAVFKSNDMGKSSDLEIPREQLFRTQTPHTYTLKKLLWAYERAKALNMTNMAATCVLMQRLGEKIYFSRGSEQNLKITTVDDLLIFKALLRTQKDKWIK